MSNFTNNLIRDNTYGVGPRPGAFKAPMNLSGIRREEYEEHTLSPFSCVETDFFEKRADLINRDSEEPDVKTRDAIYMRMMHQYFVLLADKLLKTTKVSGRYTKLFAALRVEREQEHDALLIDITNHLGEFTDGRGTTHTIADANSMLLRIALAIYLFSCNLDSNLSYTVAETKDILGQLRKFRLSDDGKDVILESEEGEIDIWEALAQVAEIVRPSLKHGNDYCITSIIPQAWVECTNVRELIAAVDQSNHTLKNHILSQLKKGLIKSGKNPNKLLDKFILSLSGKDEIPDDEGEVLDQDEEEKVFSVVDLLDGITDTQEECHVYYRKYRDRIKMREVGVRRKEGSTAFYASVDKGSVLSQFYMSGVEIGVAAVVGAGDKDEEWTLKYSLNTRRKTFSRRLYGMYMITN